MSRRGRFLREEGGVSALEFALVAPVILILFAGVSELSNAFMNSRRVAHAASACGDLAAQQTTVTTSKLTDILAASSLILQPFSTAPLSLRVTSITQQSNGIYKVDWSAAQGSALPAYGVGAVISASQLPAGTLAAAGDTVILSESSYRYVSPIAYALPSVLTFSDSALERPRAGTTITCSDCR